MVRGTDGLKAERPKGTAGSGMCEDVLGSRKPGSLTRSTAEITSTMYFGSKRTLLADSRDLDQGVRLASGLK